MAHVLLESYFDRLSITYFINHPEPSNLVTLSYVTVSLACPESIEWSNCEGTWFDHLTGSWLTSHHDMFIRLNITLP